MCVANLSASVIVGIQKAFFATVSTTLSLKIPIGCKKFHHHIHQKLQLGFLNMIAVPFWESVLGVFRMPGLQETLHSNRAYWKELKEEKLAARAIAKEAKLKALADKQAVLESDEAEAEKAKEDGDKDTKEQVVPKSSDLKRTDSSDSNEDPANGECAELYQILADAGLNMRREKMPSTEGYEDYELVFGDK